jgi:hypothetical protein
LIIEYLGTYFSSSKGKISKESESFITQYVSYRDKKRFYLLISKSKLKFCILW